MKHLLYIMILGLSTMSFANNIYLTTQYRNIIYGDNGRDGKNNHNGKGEDGKKVNLVY